MLIELHVLSTYFNLVLFFEMWQEDTLYKGTITYFPFNEIIL